MRGGTRATGTCGAGSRAPAAAPPAAALGRAGGGACWGARAAGVPSCGRGELLPALRLSSGSSRLWQLLRCEPAVNAGLP